MFSGGKIYGSGDRDGYRKVLMNEKVCKHSGADMIKLLAVELLVLSEHKPHHATSHATQARPSQFKLR
jgi:hypothetical protein